MTRAWAGTSKALAGACLGLLACAGGRALVGEPGVARDAGAARDAGPDGATPEADASAADGAPEAAAVDELLGLALPEGVAPPRRLLDGTATLTGAGRTACSHAEPASGDGHRWCAFRLPGAAAGSTELWVMDVSAAAAGAPLTCNGQDPACVRLTKTLWASYGNDFEGDTLIFYADAPATLMASQPFVGPVYAWRPGWLAPRLLASRATVCDGQLAAAVAVCLDDPRGDPGNPDDVVLRVGFLADVAGPPLAALPGRWPLRGDGGVPWQLGFAPDGQTFAISVPDGAGAPNPFAASLSVISVRDVSMGLAPTKIVADVQPWTIANDGKKVFFRRGAEADASLLSADFPTGGHELVLATKVVDFLPLGDGVADTALLLRVRLDAGGHAFQLLRDRDRPTTARTVFTNEGFLEGILVSPDLRYTAWIDPDFRARSIRVLDLATCDLNPAPAPAASDLAFLDDASALLWSEPRSDVGGARDGLFASPDRCAATTFAHGLGFLSPVGTRGIVFGDAHDENARSVTLKIAPAPLGDVAAAGGYRVHANVTTPVTLISGATSPSSLHIIFRAESDGAKDGGLYLFGPVPF